MASMLRSRPAQRADRAALDELTQHADVYEPVVEPLQRIYEFEGRIVAASASLLSEIAAPTYQPEPIGSLEAPTAPGTHQALIGCGLVIWPTLARAEILRIHRLARTLAAQEHGARYCVVTAPVLVLPPFDVGGTVQQIAAGSIVQLPVTLPIEEGYWPVGTIDDTVVMVRQNEAF